MIFLSDISLLLGSLLTALNHRYQLENHRRIIVQTLIKNPPGIITHGKSN